MSGDRVPVEDVLAALRGIRAGYRTVEDVIAEFEAEVMPANHPYAVDDRDPFEGWDPDPHGCMDPRD